MSCIISWNADEEQKKRSQTYLLVTLKIVLEIFKFQMISKKKKNSQKNLVGGSKSLFNFFKAIKKKFGKPLSKEKCVNRINLNVHIYGNKWWCANDKLMFSWATL